MSQHDHDGSHAHSHFVPPAKAYWGVFGGLLFLTVVTVAVSRVDLGPFNMLVAMGVATVKALLVGLIFMQLRWDEKLNGTVFGFGLIFVALFFIFTLADIFSRGYVDPVTDNHYLARDQVRALEKDVEKARGGVKYEVGRPSDELPPNEVAPPAPPPAPATEGAAPGSEGAAPAPEGAAPADGAAPAPEGAAPADGAAPAQP